MTMIYSNPARGANDEHALPNVETFSARIITGTCSDCGEFTIPWSEDSDTYCPQCSAVADEDTVHVGVMAWWWWICFPGCLPDGEPNGPFATELEAIEDAQSGVDEDEEELPQCAVAMGCLCAGHARGNPASAECNTNET